ncbi:Uncharacterized protein OBRU01_22202 [Operophtera brumata]|uniref:Uncharacterized protein n=1 Tax=Operophtera brumata TaxID=104452 RepID=A0A0L7KRU7_OPEBR|nr:Uncharacterized protein OBRU01_22202 [Operophtera brumata]
MLFRAAYDTPSYTHDTPSYSPTYSHEDYHDNEISKLDLLKDGIWALKTKLLEIKAFNKALAASLLSTKLKVKELMEHHMLPLKKHHHVEVDKKPVYNYQNYIGTANP